MKDPYRIIAKKYDRVFGRMVEGLRIAGLRIVRPSGGMNILDVGCGTGRFLGLFHRYGCNLYGLDQSPSMLDVAKGRLGDTARLEYGNAISMPYENRKFDLIISMLTLHEMSQQTRLKVISEMKRVLKNDGRMLLIDYQPGPYKTLQGWLYKVIIFLSELGAGREHFSNYRQFLSQKGLSALAALNELEIVKQNVLAGGTFAVLVLSLRSS
ncbi:MAG: methyltransferase domain-containing protein [Bacteroidales bacterium]